jgi:hypothetical protein
MAEVPMCHNLPYVAATSDLVQELVWPCVHLNALETEGFRIPLRPWPPFAL